MKTVKVRVAVAVDPTGKWNSFGTSDYGDDESMALAVDVLEDGEAQFWLEAELPVPETKTVKAKVTN